MKLITYLCVEDGELFTITAENIEAAKEKASIWNAQVIKPL
tara:strand:+ start:1234 stop:1356 length:123 start_codon:yes stop_codon:yes gene_type:complete